MVKYRTKKLAVDGMRMAMEEYMKLPEYRHVELIGGIGSEPPPPFYGHGEVAINIGAELWMFCKQHPGLGSCFMAPFGVFLDDTTNVVDPDVLVILKDNPGKHERLGYFHGSPDFVVEVLSIFNRKHDLQKKKTLYEKFGVKEYWIVDPNTKDVIAYTFENGRYVNLPTKPGTIDSPLLGFFVNF